jgi:uncharacterized protein (DUF927 family)
MSAASASAAKQIWAGGTSAVDPVVDAYLQTRGLTPLNPAPPCLRFAANLQHPDSYYFPAILVQATNPADGKPTGGIHRLFLARGGKSKAQVDRAKQKMSLGPMKGGVARLAEPIDGKPLLIGEGIETVLTGMQATGLPGWSVFGVSGLKSFAPPDTVKHVVLLAENDQANGKALAALSPALTGRGIKVDIARPAPGLKDLNDCINGKSGHTSKAGLAMVKAAIEDAIAGASASTSARAAAAPPDPLDGKFLLDGTGLYRRKNKKWDWIAQAFEILALARDAAAEGWSKVIRFDAYGQLIRTMAVSVASLHSDAADTINALVNQGMKIKCTMTARRLFAEFLAAAEVTSWATLAHCTGWIQIDGKRAFVLPKETIGAKDLKETVILAGTTNGPYERRGTLEDWQAGVGKLAGNHCVLRFSVAVAFAGPLLDLGGFESGVFHLYGRSSEGKTTCLRAAASVWGSGADGAYVRTWRATSNGLEANLAGACDTLLPTDEVGMSEGKEIGQALYMTASGVGKQRMQRDATLKPSHRWRVLMLSSGELPVEARLNEDVRRARAHAGHLVRAIDIAARREFGVFDRPYVDADFEPKKAADKLKRATLTHYGTAGPEYVRQLIERQITSEAVRQRVASFVEDALKGIKDPHGQAGRAAERFGLVAAAGELAIELGVVPWTKGELTADAYELFAAWLRARGGAVPYETRQIVAQVRRFMEAHGESRFDDVDPPPKNSFTGDMIERKPVTNRAGWRRGKGEDRRWHVPPETFRQEICAGLNPTEAARVLAETGALEKGADGRLTQVVRLPEMKPQRLYVLTPCIFDDCGEEGE